MNRLLAFSVGSPGMVVLLASVFGAFGWAALSETPVDAFPDLSDNQVIVYTDWMGRSPQDVEDQITYPLSTALQGVPGVRDLRGMSAFGFSQVYVVFEDDIDIYWARTRVLEKLSTLGSTLPAGVQPQLGPDATALGQVFWYALEGPGHDLAELRSLQDFTLRYALQAVPGVSEVASVGGAVRQYQIELDPSAMLAYGVSTRDVITAVRRGSVDVGAKTVERSGLELVIRGVGFIKQQRDIEDLVVTERGGTPVFVRHVANVQLGPDFRRGALADERDERVGGVVTMRYGANPKAVIDGVKERLEALKPALPEGVRVVPFYDRSQLVDETMGTLRETLALELIITVVVVLLFLLHVRTSLVVAATLPLAVLLCFLAMRALDLGADIMALTGIAIAIGTVVDMGIIMAEAIYAQLTESPDRPRGEVIAEAAAEVAPAIVTAVSTTVISFLPVFFLTGQAGRLFKPLAWTKSLTMIAALLCAVTIVPALCRLVLRDSDTMNRRARQIAVGAFAGLGGALGAALPGAGVLAGAQPWVVALIGGCALGALAVVMTTERLRPLEDNVVARAIVGAYQPTLRWLLEHKRLFAVAPAAIAIGGLLVAFGARPITAPLRALGAAFGADMSQSRPLRALDAALPPLGSEFMPPLDEGSYLAMPSLLPQASLSETLRVMRRMNEAIATVPEVAQVMGKLGRAETALDPAPVAMLETVVNLHPKALWRDGVTAEDILAELKTKSQVVGTTPSWLQPIETRIVMLQSGIRATMALRLIGAPRDPEGRPYRGLEAHMAIERAALAVEDVVRRVPGATAVTTLRQGGKPYLELHIDRAAVARYGLTIADVADVIETAIGGKNLSWSLEGRERYPIRVAWSRELRDSPERLERILVPTRSGAQIPISAVAELRAVQGPASVRTENGQLVGYVMFNAAGRDEAAVMDDAVAAVKRWRAERRSAGDDPIPAGLTVSPTGRYLHKIEADRRLMIIVPLVLALNFFLIFLQFRSFTLTATLALAIPVAFGGGFLLLAAWPHLLDLLHAVGLRARPSPGPIYLTTAVWVGFIALFGIAVDDGVVVGTYLRQVFSRRAADSVAAIREGVIEAGSRRIRPMLMTTVTTLAALLPILWSTGRGSDLMLPMALPVVGGMLFAFISVFVVPVAYAAALERQLPARAVGPSAEEPPGA